MAATASAAAKQIQNKFKEVLPLLNRVLVKKPEVETVTKGGVVIPDGMEPKLNKATVVAVGPGEVSETGKVIPVGLKPGDEVILSNYDGIKIELENDEVYYLYKENEILAKVINE
ncbi:unnamed protein product [Psylliodes chrysocephalus]|uniref:10 kDa heat shock protein, mitochondrial n=1 Tax=Psylliodes chrysocephalus TaxID=3402493 RepID=A0A9P0CJL6_9CUCU|nr:unnamed protein product [Psylliodes chrysocephala]